MQYLAIILHFVHVNVWIVFNMNSKTTIATEFEMHIRERQEEQDSHKAAHTHLLNIYTSAYICLNVLGYVYMSVRVYDTHKE